MSEVTCSICGKQFDHIPPDAVQIGQRHGAFHMYRFSDGSVHDLGPVKKEAQHAATTAKEQRDVNDF